MSAYAQVLTPPPKVLVDKPKAEEVDAATKVAEHFNAEGFKLDDKPLEDVEKIWLSREVIIRFYNYGGDKNVETTISKLEDTLRWRRSLDLYDLDKTAEGVKNEAVFGCRFIAGFHNGWPVIYIFANKNQVPVEERTQLHNVFYLDRADDLSPAGVQNCVSIMNFGGEQLGPAPTLGQTQEMLGIIGKHYPGYVGLSFLQEMGWTMTAFVNVVWPFIDAETRNRTKTVNGPQAIDQGLVESDELIEAVGGDLDFEYDYDAYFPALVRVCKERRAQYLANWKALGPPVVGRPEADYKTATVTV